MGRPGISSREVEMGSRRKIMLLLLVVCGAVVALSGSAATGTPPQPSPEPRFLVGAEWHLSFHCGGADVCDEATVCNFDTQSTEILRGPESDVSTHPHPELNGVLKLRIVAGEFQDKELGRIDATLRNESGLILYSGSGPFVGRSGGGAVVDRGILTATLYENGKPTSRQLVANFAYQITDHGLTGGFGA